MLNYNKIDSSINFERTAKTKLSQYLGIANSTLVDRLKKKNLTPDDVEGIAEFFNKPMTYFFDKEENVLNDPSEPYTIKKINCLECISKQKEIDLLTATLEAKEELLDMYRDKKSQKCG